MGLLSLPMMIKAFAWMANRNEKAKAMIRGNKTIQLEVEGEEPICIHFADNKVTFEKGRAEKPNVVIRATRKRSQDAERRA